MYLHSFQSRSLKFCLVPCSESQFTSTDGAWAPWPLTFSKWMASFENCCNGLCVSQERITEHEWEMVTMQVTSWVYEQDIFAVGPLPWNIEKFFHQHFHASLSSEMELVFVQQWVRNRFLNSEKSLIKKERLEGGREEREVQECWVLRSQPLMNNIQPILEKIQIRTGIITYTC